MLLFLTARWAWIFSKEQKIRRSVLQKFYLQEQLEAWKKQFDKKEELFLSEAETERFLREWTVKESYVKRPEPGFREICVH